MQKVFPVCDFLSPLSHNSLWFKHTELFTVTKVTTTCGKIRLVHRLENMPKSRCSHEPIACNSGRLICLLFLLFLSRQMPFLAVKWLESAALHNEIYHWKKRRHLLWTWAHLRWTDKSGLTGQNFRFFQEITDVIQVKDERDHPACYQLRSPASTLVHLGP